MAETEYFLTFDRRTGEPIGVMPSTVAPEQAAEEQAGTGSARKASDRIAVMTVSITFAVIAVAVVLLVLIGSRIHGQSQVIVCPTPDSTAAAVPAPCAPQGVSR